MNAQANFSIRFFSFYSSLFLLISLFLFLPTSFCYFVCFFSSLLNSSLSVLQRFLRHSFLLLSSSSSFVLNLSPKLLEYRDHFPFRFSLFFVLSLIFVLLSILFSILLSSLPSSRLFSFPFLPILVLSISFFYFLAFPPVYFLFFSLPTSITISKLYAKSCHRVLVKNFGRINFTLSIYIRITTISCSQLRLSSRNS